MKHKFQKGMVVTGIVTGIQDYGIFVQLQNSSSGLIHISEISKKFVKNINDYVTIGEVIRAEVLDQVDENHYQLSIKDLDYRVMKKHGSKITETPSGFKNLALNLEIWVQEKDEEQKKKQN